LRAVRPSLKTVLAVAAGGALGTGLRYGLGVSFPTPPGAFPYVTFFENVLGSFLLGAFLTVAANWKRGAVYRSLLGTGVLGSFTTFSALSLALVQLEAPVALLYGASSLLVGLLAASSGVWVTRQLLKR